jgi:hypothetical protein
MVMIGPSVHNRTNGPTAKIDALADTNWNGRLPNQIIALDLQNQLHCAKVS